MVGTASDRVGVTLNPYVRTGVQKSRLTNRNDLFALSLSQPSDDGKFIASGCHTLVDGGLCLAYASPEVALPTAIVEPVPESQHPG